MKVLVINSGSSSIKFKLFDMSDETVLASGLVERIGESKGRIRCSFPGGPDGDAAILEEMVIKDHESGMLRIGELLSDSRRAVVRSKDEITAVGHRVVHGGEDFRQPVIVDEAVIGAIRKNSALAPLHNPANLDGIEVSGRLFDRAIQVAVFDTAFHQSIPERAYLYALPYEYYAQYRIRRYGFHGTSHKYVAGECAALLGKSLSECNLITAHLGNGCSMTAIEHGRSIDTSLGMTPLEGLVMGTRSGDIDPAIHVFLHRNAGLSLEQIDLILNMESGLKGLCGMNDMRDIHQAAASGDEHARLALEVQAYRLRKYFGSYIAVLGRVDALVFTGGIGENDHQVRACAVEGLGCFSIEIDSVQNEQPVSEPRLISAPTSGVQIWVIPTNEELAIARETVALLSNSQ